MRNTLTVQSLKHFFHKPHGVLTGLIIFALFCLYMNSLKIDSITYKTVGSNEPAITANAPYIQTKAAEYEANITFHYRGFGNTSLQLTPRFCFKDGYKINGEFLKFPDQQDKWCGDLVIGLRQYLHRGENTLNVTLSSTVPSSLYVPNIGIAVGNPMFGRNVLQSFFTLILTCSSLGLLWLWMKRKGDDLTCRMLFISSTIAHLLCIQYISQFAYAFDLEKHLTYIQFVTDHAFMAHDYRGPESWHPATYYELCAVVISFFQWIGVIDPYTSLRLVSFGLYNIFLYIGMRTIGLLFKASPFNIALFMLLFWPSGLFSAAWVFNDLMVYPLYAACFYHTLNWYQNDRAKNLNWALVFAGLTFAVKTTALIPASILGVIIFFQIKRRRLAL